MENKKTQSRRKSKVILKVLALEGKVRILSDVYKDDNSLVMALLHTAHIIAKEDFGAYLNAYFEACESQESEEENNSENVEVI